MEKNIIINDDIERQLRIIIEYLIDSEQTHFQESSKKDKETHIYKSVIKVKNWLKEQNEV
jgi:hypothetical protein